MNYSLSLHCTFAPDELKCNNPIKSSSNTLAPSTSSSESPTVCVCAFAVVCILTVAISLKRQPFFGSTKWFLAWHHAAPSKNRPFTKHPISGTHSSLGSQPSKFGAFPFVYCDAFQEIVGNVHPVTVRTHRKCEKEKWIGRWANTQKKTIKREK